MSTLLTDIVRKQTTASVVNTITRSIDIAAEELAHDLLRDPDFRAHMQQLLRAAFEQTLKELNEPTPPTTP